MVNYQEPMHHHIVGIYTQGIITAREKNDKVAVAEKLHIYSTFPSKYK